jgi:hypothetical protein
MAYMRFAQHEPALRDRAQLLEQQHPGVTCRVVGSNEEGTEMTLTFITDAWAGQYWDEMQRDGARVTSQTPEAVTDALTVWRDVTGADPAANEMRSEDQPGNKALRSWTVGVPG